MMKWGTPMNLGHHHKPPYLIYAAYGLFRVLADLAVHGQVLGIDLLRSTLW